MIVLLAITSEKLVAEPPIKKPLMGFRFVLPNGPWEMRHHLKYRMTMTKCCFILANTWGKYCTTLRKPTCHEPNIIKKVTWKSAFSFLMSHLSRLYKLGNLCIAYCDIRIFHNMKQLNMLSNLEILWFRAIDIQGLIGNVGGYIGLLLGYSFLQIPDFIILNVYHMWECWNILKPY